MRLVAQPTDDEVKEYSTGVVLLRTRWRNSAEVFDFGTPRGDDDAETRRLSSCAKADQKSSAAIVGTNGLLPRIVSFKQLMAASGGVVPSVDLLIRRPKRPQPGLPEGSADQLTQHRLPADSGTRDHEPKSCTLKCCPLPAPLPKPSEFQTLIDHARAAAQKHSQVIVEALLIQRTSDHLELPKGHVEPDDVSFPAAALRELREETGITNAQVHVGKALCIERYFVKSTRPGPHFGKIVGKSVTYYFAYLMPLLSSLAAAPSTSASCLASPSETGISPSRDWIENPPVPLRYYSAHSAGRFPYPTSSPIELGHGEPETRRLVWVEADDLSFAEFRRQTVRQAVILAISEAWNRLASEWPNWIGTSMLHELPLAKLLPESHTAPLSVANAEAVQEQLAVPNNTVCGLMEESSTTSSME